MKRLVLAAALAAGVLFASPTSAGAWATFCDWDPIVPIITPAGHVVLLYDSVWTPSPLDLGLPLETHKVSHIYNARLGTETLVNVTIYTPTGLLFRYATTDEVTSGLLGSGHVYARGSGYSGSPVHLSFVLDTP